MESHVDFDRDFRGDSLHPYTLELLAQLGLADALLDLPHFAATRFRMHTPAGTIVTSDYGQLPTPYAYVALMQQARFVDFMARRAAELPTFTLLTGARVRELIVDDDRVTGVRWRGGSSESGDHELSARLVVAADGRFSKLRALAEVPITTLDASSDLLWFRLPRRPDDPPEADVDLYIGANSYVALLGGDIDWQIGYSLPKGSSPGGRRRADPGVPTDPRRLAGRPGRRADRLRPDHLVVGRAQARRRVAPPGHAADRRRRAGDLPGRWQRDPDGHPGRGRRGQPAGPGAALSWPGRRRGARCGRARPAGR